MKLELYMFDTCPFCRRVIGEINKSGRNDITFYNILNDDDARKRLIKVGGKRQDQCLFIDVKPMYESGDIIKLLNENPQK